MKTSLLSLFCFLLSTIIYAESESKFPSAVNFIHASSESNALGKIAESDYFEFYTTLEDGATYWSEISENIDDWYIELCSYWDRPGITPIFDPDNKTAIYLLDKEAFTTESGGNLPAWKCGDFQNSNTIITRLPAGEQSMYENSYPNLVKNTLGQFILDKHFGGSIENYFKEAFGLFYAGYQPKRDSVLKAISVVGETPTTSVLHDIENLSTTYQKDLITTYVESQVLSIAGIQFVGPGNYLDQWYAHLNYYYKKPDEERIKLMKQTERFDIYAAESDRSRMDKIGETLEARLIMYENRFDFPIKHKLYCVVYPTVQSRGDCLIISGGNGGSGWSGDKLDVCSPSEGWDEDGFYGFVVPHELFHVFHFNLVTYLFQVPAFYAEGLANFMALGFIDLKNKDDIWKIDQTMYFYNSNFNHDPTLENLLTDKFDEAYEYQNDPYFFGEIFYNYIMAGIVDYNQLKSFFINDLDWSAFNSGYEEIDSGYIHLLKQLAYYLPKDTLISIPFDEPFNSFENGWTKPSYQTADNWQISDGGMDGTNCARLYIYSDKNEPVDSWLVSPALDAENKNQVQLSFDFARYGDDIELEVYYTDKFDGNTDLTDWTLVKSVDMPTNWGWSNTGKITINNPPDTVFIGLRKKSPGTQHLQFYIDNFNVKTQELTEIPFSDDFTNDYENWDTYSASGDLQWHISGDDGPDGSKCARIYTNNSPEENDDWLLSPVFNTSGVSNIKITFDYWYYGSSLTPEFYYSTNYTGDYENADWTKINYSFAINEWTWKNIYFNLEVPDETFAFAFRYQSGVGDDDKIQIDNFSITEMETSQHLTAWQAASEMKHGINLGNTMEPPTEAGWNNPKAQEYYFDLYKEAGFDVVRIPVRWDNYTDQTSPYKIDDYWLNRVEQLVDWGLERGLYIVINAHHEDWLKENYDNPDYQARFDSIWSQVATHFKDKTDKLIFEIFNEPTTQSAGLTVEQNNEVNARIISIIRKTNPTRIVIFQGNDWGGSYDLFEAAVPEDDYLMGSYHSYSPYEFALLGEGTFTEEDYNNLRNEFINVKNWSDANQIPVFLGEFGALKSCDYNSRMKQYSAYVTMALEFNVIPCAWDDGGNFRIMEREEKYWDEVKDILIYNSMEAPNGLNLKVHQDSTIKVSWTNEASDNDSIFVERRKSTDTFYTKIATLKSDESVFYDVKPAPETTYHYRVIAHYNDTTDEYSYPQKLYMPFYITSVEKVPELTSQFKVYPNPITNQSVISFQTKSSGEVDLSIFDIQGRKICTLINEKMNAGLHTLPVANSLPDSGVYLCKLQTPEGISIVKLIKRD